MKNDYIEKTLSNGIKVYIYSDKNLKRVYASYNVNYGTDGYFDNFILDGREYHVEPALAHFLEHLLIETSLNGNMLLRYSDKNYESNGLTYSDLTSYYFLGIDSKKNIYESLKELIYMVERPIFNRENIRKVKSAICEELKKSSDSKYQIARSNNRHNLHKNYDAVPKDNNVLGTVASTNSITITQVKACYDAYYNDENKFIVIGGNINVDEVINELESIYKDIPPHLNKMKEFPYSSDFSVRKKREVIERECDADYVITSYKIKNTFSISNLKLDIYISIYLSLKLDSSNEFISSLIKNKIVNNGIGFSADFFKDVITIFFSFESYNADAALEALQGELNLENLDREEFELAKKEYIVSELRRKDHIYGCFRRFPTVIMFSKHMLEIDTINSITYDEMIEVISKLKFDTYTTTIVTNKKED